MIKKLEIAGVIIFLILLIIIFAQYMSKKNSSNINDDTLGPGDVVEKYFQTMTNGDFEGANYYYDQVDQANYTALAKEEYFYKVHWALYGVNIGEESITDDTAKVKVTINKFNHIKIMVNVKRKLLEIADDPTLSVDKIEELKKRYIAEEYSSGTADVVTNEYQINLIMQNDEWKIVNDNIIKDILFGSQSNLE